MRNWLTTKKLSRFDTLALMVYAALLAQYRFWTACWFLVIALLVSVALEWRTPSPGAAGGGR